MDPIMPQEVVQEKLARVVPIKIGDVLCHTDNEIFRNLSEFYRVDGTVPLTEEKNIIGLFRKMVQVDNYFEKLANT